MGESWPILVLPVELNSMFGVVLLVFLFGEIVVRCGFDLRDDVFFRLFFRFLPLTLEFRSPRYLLLFRTMVENDGTILFAAIGPLTIEGGGIVNLPK